jgi:hypothetical protein
MEDLHRILVKLYYVNELNFISIDNVSAFLDFFAETYGGWRLVLSLKPKGQPEPQLTIQIDQPLPDTICPPTTIVARVLPSSGNCVEVAFLNLPLRVIFSRQSWEQLLSKQFEDEVQQRGSIDQITAVH